MEVAYDDVSRAFEFYLKNYNDGKAIIIAGHSQGSIMAKELVKDYFDDKELQNRLIAAYLPGIRVQVEEFKTVKPMTQPDQVGGFVSWNTYKRKNFPKTYEKWYKGGVTTNPITWNEEIKTSRENHLGILNVDGIIYENAIDIEVVDGLLWSSVPKIPKRFWLSFIKSYHFADVNLFWKDIELNAQLRASKWEKLNNAN